MATGTLSPAPWFTGLDDDGEPLSGGLLYTYAAGTSTPLATYSEVTLTTANANPVVLDSAGRCTLFLSATSYKFVLKTSAGVTIRTQDNIGSVPAATVDTDVTGTAGVALSATKAAYLLASTWLLADADAAASSTLPPIGFVVTDIANGASGTLRTAGRMTGFSGLTPGSDYFLSGTAGEITATAPAFARYVGRADSISTLIITPNPPLTPSGQIVFPATQNASTDVNALDDYEEGTWTPVISGSGGGSGQTYSVQVGSYVKVGKLVTATFQVRLSALGTVTTQARVGGLPFSIENTTNGEPSLHVGFWTAMTSSFVYLAGLGVVNSTNILLYGATAAGTGLASVVQADLSNTSAIYGVIQYRATA